MIYDFSLLIYFSSSLTTCDSYLWFMVIVMSYEHLKRLGYISLMTYDLSLMIYDSPYEFKKAYYNLWTYTLFKIFFYDLWLSMHYVSSP